MNEIEMDQVVREHGADILRFCRMTAGNREEGDELYQDTMLKLLEKQSGLDESGNIKSYALSVAIKLWTNRKRKFARRLRLVPQDSLEVLTEQGGNVAIDSADPEEQVLKSREIHEVRSMVAALPEKYRIPIYLHFSANLSIKEISTVLKLPENTVKSRLHRGKERLRKNLEDAGYDG